jgi:Mn2+/Fe2+ NRAMP family transporter
VSTLRGQKSLSHVGEAYLTSTTMRCPVPARDEASGMAMEISDKGPVRASVAAVGVLAVWGPGLVVMLADTDAGSLITAAQSGAQWGYRMVLPQVILIPILYVVQEMTVRLGIVTGEGHGALIRAWFGRGWAWASAFTLVAAGIGALVTEFAGVAGVGQLFGVSRWLTIPVSTAALLALMFTGSYRRVERIGIAFGGAELAFIVVMVMSGHVRCGAAGGHCRVPGGGVGTVGGVRVAPHPQ